MVRWTARALNNIREIRDYIARDSPAIAQRTATSLVHRAKQLSRFPNSGPIVQEHRGRAVRELVEESYHLFYEVRAEDVFVLGVVHGRRNLRAFLRNLGEHS